MKNQVSKVVTDAERLLKILKDTNTTLIELTDLSVPFDDLNTAATRKALSRKVKSLVNPRKEGNRTVYDVVCYYGALAIGEENIRRAGEALMSRVNMLCKRGLITGCLAPLSMLQLHTEPWERNQFAVVIFVTLTTEGMKQEEHCNHPMFLKEGQCPSFRVE